ncbi:lmo0954 family membrane protein [Bacillus alkalisoli]|uniref:lmo0954 family membrane protein n=1 Tax=Bacillus alkalisoli TaxID=2011008 RepID=UPI000C2493B4|nr:flagellar basal body rod protein [Bacillus alkalisoli]
MKKIGLFLIGIIAFFVLLGNVGPLIGLAISLIVAYYAVKEFLKIESTGSKIAWGIIAFIAIAFTISNVPAVIALVAAYVLYLVYKKWNQTKEETNPPSTKETSDPFTNFEKQWNLMNK